MDKEIIRKLERQLNLTDLESDPEEYILTPEEEEIALEWEVKRMKEHKLHKYLTQGLPEMDALLRVSKDVFSVNREEVLVRANSNKQYGRWQQQRRDNEKEAQRVAYEKLKEEWTAKNVFKLMQWTSREVYGKKLIVSEENKAFITALCYFISGDSKFESECGYSFKKGLLIRGVSGLGKTHLVSCVSKNKIQPILMLSMIEITDAIKKEGEYQVEMGDNKLLYLDDVGTEEPTVNHYGTKISFFKNFIESYYLRQNPFSRLLISTNNSFSEIDEMYGFRVKSRLREMFNVINVTGTDMRG